MPSDANGSAPVSVVIPCYRCSTTIGRAVESVFQQEMRPNELILVDDASGDATLSVLSDIQSQFPAGWIRVISLPRNGGPSTARNAGWEAAQEPFVAFLDADDSWHPQKIKIQLTLMLANPSVALTAHRYVIESDHQSTRMVTTDSPPRRLSFKRMLVSNPISTPTVMLRRELSMRFQEGKRYAEDYLLWLQIACRHDCWFIDAPLATLYKAPFGLSGLSANMWEMEKGVFSTFLALYREQQISLMLFAGLIPFSFLKFIRRILLVSLKRV
jgi:glycosyltransferase involved in cell wall biosynthesis